MNWILPPELNPDAQFQMWPETASIPLVRELIRRHAELPEYVLPRLSGTRAQKNAIWKEYRNYVHQGLSYFDAALNVRDRSATLLYYYAVLNFAKAELIYTQAPSIMGQRIVHGLSYSPTWAKTLSADFIRVQGGGIFPLLYEARTGQKIPRDQRLRISSLLSNVQKSQHS
jgi:hypothetical protein